MQREAVDVHAGTQIRGQLPATAAGEHANGFAGIRETIDRRVAQATLQFLDRSKLPPKKAGPDRLVRVATGHGRVGRFDGLADSVGIDERQSSRVVV